MKIGKHNTADAVYVIAEAGNNHEGDFGLAKELVGLAAEGGANAIKFQAIRPKHLVHKSHVERFATVTRFELSMDQYEALAAEAERCNIDFLATPFDMGMLAFLEPMMPAIKIASSDNTFYPLVAKAFATGKPVIMSSGFSSRELIMEVCAFVASLGAGRDDWSLLHCVSKYPTAWDELQLNNLHWIREHVDAVPGFSDHTMGHRAAGFAVAAGARIVEKHFTISKNHSDFHDHKISVEPEELKTLVAEIREVEALMGGSERHVHQAEIDAIPAVRRSICALEGLAADTMITEKHLDWLRFPGDFPAGKEAELIGRKLARPIEAGEPFMRDLLA